MSDLGVWGGTADLADDASERRLQEQRDYEMEHPLPRSPAVERNYTGPYCHRCRAKVDHRRTDDPMAPWAVYDRDTDQLHRLRCYDPRRR